MAPGYDERIILKNEEKFSDGHRVQYDLVVDNLDAKESYILDQNHTITCEIFPTSWKFRLIIRPVGANAIVNIPVSVTRCDSSDFPVNASIDVILSNARGETFLNTPKYFNKPFLASHDELLGYVAGYLETPQLVQTFNEMLVIRVIIVIRYCHAEDITHIDVNTHHGSVNTHHGSVNTHHGSVNTHHGSVNMYHGSVNTYQ